MNTTEKQIDLIFVPPITNPVLIEQEQNFIPVGLLALLASIEECGFYGEIYQPRIAILKESDIQKVAKDILLLAPKAVGFSTWCNSYPLAILIAQKIHEINSEIPIIFGGPQASSVGELTMRFFPFINYILQGEADLSLGMLLETIMGTKNYGLENIHGLIFRDIKSDDNVIHRNVAFHITELDQLPIPKYSSNLSKKYISIDIGRGCPYHCTYCSTSLFFSKNYRIKSIDRIIKEIDYCYTNFKSRWYSFSHDMISLNMKFTLDLSTRISNYFSNTKVKFGWTCSARVDCITEDLLVEMSNGGCSGIFFGIESGSRKVQKLIRKNLNVVYARKIVEKSAMSGIHTAVSYIIGFPFETKMDMNDTLISVLEMAMVGAEPQMSLLSLLPGTPLYKQYKNNLKYDGQNSDFTDLIVPEFAIKTITNHPEIFSSYFYLENIYTPRETLLFISNVVNLLNSFIPTLVKLGYYLDNSFRKINILGFIEEKLPEYKKKYSKSEPELFFLFESFKNYLLTLSNRRLPLFCWSIFQVDYTKSFVLYKYRKWQSKNIQEKRQFEFPKNLKSTQNIEILPFWEIVKSEFYIYQALINPANNKNQKHRRGEFYYLVSAVSYRDTEVWKLPKKIYKILSNISSMRVDEYARHCYPEFNYIESMRLLRTLFKLKVLVIRK